MLDMFFITIPVQASPTLQQLFGGLSKWPDLLYTCNFVFVPINDNNTHHHDHLNHDDNICLSPSAPPCPPRTATSLLNMDHCFEDRQAFISIINIIIGILIKHNHHQGEGACYIKSPNSPHNHNHDQGEGASYEGCSSPHPPQIPPSHASPLRSPQSPGSRWPSLQSF